MCLTWHSYELETETFQEIWEGGEPQRLSEMQEELGTSSCLLVGVQRDMEVKRKEERWRKDDMLTE